MKVLILGGTGAMGASLVPILAAEGNEVYVTSRSLRKTDNEKIHYIQGNAHELTFLCKVLKTHYDAIVDFMAYTTDEFRERYTLLLDSTYHYVFLSPSRVYADFPRPITEDDPRLLDICNDRIYLHTDEYALQKARQENILRESGKQNWTIVRPYITYSNERLQLGVFEKEVWLYRALQNKTVVFPKAIAKKYTTMTLGKDVAEGISKLIGNEKAFGTAFHITTDECIKWDDVLNVYKRVFKDVTGRDIRIKYIDDPKTIYEAYGNKYQVIYDRLFDRRFDNNKFMQAAGVCGFTPVREGLERCLREFLSAPRFKGTQNLAIMDKMANEKTKLSSIPGIKGKAKYVIVRYFPDWLVRRLKAVFRFKM